MYKYKCAYLNFLCTTVLTTVLSKRLSAVEICISDQCDTQWHSATQNRQCQKKDTFTLYVTNISMVDVEKTSKRFDQNRSRDDKLLHLAGMQ